MPKQRLDILLVEKGLIESREKAQRVIRAGQVSIKDQTVSKPGVKYDTESEIKIKELPRYVSRGGSKLEIAFDDQGLNVTGLSCLDVGASTGGFTDCLLQHGAAKVIAVDVGKGQLHWNLRNDPRVLVMENVNARYLIASDLAYRPEFACVDVSFISLKKIMPALKLVLLSGSQLVTLIKPQFEAGREFVEKGGVVRDSRVHEDVISDVKRFGTQELGFDWLWLCESPLKGPAGNIEFLAGWRVP